MTAKEKQSQIRFIESQIELLCIDNKRLTESDFAFLRNTYQESTAIHLYTNMEIALENYLKKHPNANVDEQIKNIAFLKKQSHYIHHLHIYLANLQGQIHDLKAMKALLLEENYKIRDKSRMFEHTFKELENDF
jgi:hypothetical protein